MAKEGISYQTQSGASQDALLDEYMPLEMFDDITYDPRTPQEWAAFAKADQTMAKALYSKDGFGRWRDCRLLSYNEQEEKYQIQWEHTNDIELIPRIHLLFSSEDPFIFAERVVKAHKERKKAEAYLRYNLYVDSMPIDDIPDNEQVLRILASTLNVKKFKGI